MAAAAVATLERSPHTIAGGMIVAPAPASSPHPSIGAFVGDHPLPGPQSFAAAAGLTELTARVRSDDRVLVLLSGGASSLVAAPLAGLSDEDLVRLFGMLHRSGLDIRGMNAVRKRFTRWGAGRLALALAPARVDLLAISDVPGDDLADIASGPCSPDGHVARDVLGLVERSALLPALPTAMRRQLEDALHGVIPETPKPGHPAFSRVRARVVGSNRLALESAVARAAELTWPAMAVRAPLEGEASRRGVEIAESLLERAERGEEGCVVWGGETTVQLSTGPIGSGGELPASGGRCQELALAAAGRLAMGGAGSAHVALLAAGTDGRDGPTDAAGAFADASLWDAIARSGRDPARALARHESYTALDAVGALLRRGHTGTNVMDVVIGVVDRRPLHAR